MRYEKGHKDETRRRVVEVAARKFKKDGIEATGIAGVMAEAGLTHGGFYAHFASKEDLIRSAIDSPPGRTADAFAATALKARGEGRDGLQAIVERYLRPLHRDHPENGCTAAALAPELGRLSKGPRQAFGENIDGIIKVIAAEIPSQPSETAYATASAIFSLMMGALQLSRAVADPIRSEALLVAGRGAALALGGRTTIDPRRPSPSSAKAGP